ncbi:MAG: multidrug effflux MFS transporter [Pseudomonadota bacterium]
MTNKHTATPGRGVPFILAACTAVSILSTDMITPSIPDLPEALGTTVNAAQLTVSVNLAAYALAQLVHGPVADAIGRRRLLISAFMIFAVFSAYCATRTSIDQLLFGRFLQGLTSSVPSVVIVLIIRELYDPRRALRVMTLYGATLGIAPAVGPLLGGYLHVGFGWTAGFWFVAGLALIVAGLVWRNVPESLMEQAPLNLRASMRAYGGLLRRPQFIGSVLAVSLLFAAYFCYITAAPVVFIDLIGLPTQHYGLTSLVIVGAFILGNIVASRLSKSIGAPTLLRWGAYLMTGAMAVLTVPILFGVLSIPLILTAMGIYGGCLAIILAAGPLVVLNHASGAAQGPASALLGSVQLGLSAVAGYVAAMLFNGTAIPMVLVMSTAVVMGTVLLVMLNGSRELGATGDLQQDPAER